MNTVKLILISKDGTQLYVRNLEKDYHTQFGFVKKDDLKRLAKTGGVATTNTAQELVALPLQFIDLYKKIKRVPQIIPLKDVGAIAAETGLNKESRVVDAGAGSGALACFLAHLVKEVTSYELRPEYAEVAQLNAKYLQLANLKVKNKDVYQGIEEKDVDVITLDLPEPWKALEPADKALKVGGFIVSYSPTIPQVIDFVEAATAKGFLHLKTVELIEREWEIKERVVRPKSRQIGHSGFLTFIRKMR